MCKQLLPESAFMSTMLLRMLLFLLLAQTAAAQSGPWSIHRDPDSSLLQINLEDKSLVSEINFRAVEQKDRQPSYQAQCVNAPTLYDGWQQFTGKVTGPHAEHSNITWLCHTTGRGIVLQMHLQCTADLTYNRWLTGIHFKLNEPVVDALPSSADHWADQTDKQTQLPGDMPYRKVAAQVRRITVKNQQKITIATDLFDPGWDHWDQTKRAQRADNVPFSPGDGPVDRIFRIGFFDDQMPTWMIAAALHGDPLAGRITCPQTANLYEPNESISMNMQVANVTDTTQTAIVTYEIHDYQDKQLAQFNQQYQLNSNDTIDCPINLPGQPQGMLFVSGRITCGSWSRPIWSTVGILPKRPITTMDSTSPFGLAHLFKGQADQATIISLGQRIGTHWWRRFQKAVTPFTDTDAGQLRDELEKFKANGICVQLQFQAPDDRPAKEYADCYAKAAGIAQDYGNYLCPGNEMNPRPIGKRKVSAAEQQQAGKEHALNLQKPFYQAVKSQSDQLQVTTQAMGGIPVEYVQGFGKAGGFDWIDTLNFHPYFYPHSPEFAGKGYYVLTRHFQTAANACKQFGAKSWIISETGYPTVTKATRGVSLRTQADYMVRTYALMLASGCKLVEWYTLQDGRGIDPSADPNDEQSNFGMLFTDLSPKPAYVAYGVMTAQLDGMHAIGRYDLGDPELYAIGFGKTTKPEVFVLWSFREKDERDIEKPRKPMMPWKDRYDHPETVTLRATAPVTVTDIMGRVRTLEQSSVKLELNGSPIYVRHLDLQKTCPVGLIK
jgi:hypothetical protein